MSLFRSFASDRPSSDEGDIPTLIRTMDVGSNLISECNLFRHLCVSLCYSTQLVQHDSCETVRQRSTRIAAKALEEKWTSGGRTDRSSDRVLSSDSTASAQ